MARTRSKPKPAKETTPDPPISTAKPLPPSTTNPPKLFVLPRDTSSDSRIVTLDNPANGIPSRYYFCPNKGFYEFTRIATPKKDCRSWLITPNIPRDEAQDTKDEETSSSKRDNDDLSIASGYLTNKADLFLATPFDTLFLLLPALAPKSLAEKQHFLAFEDHLDALSSTGRQWKVILAQYPSLKDKLEKRMAAVCDTVTAGDETMYRLSQEKLIGILVQKAQRMCANGLPPSMEDRFIKPALEVPVMSIRREEVPNHNININNDDLNADRIHTRHKYTTRLANQPVHNRHLYINRGNSTHTPSKHPPEIPTLLRLRTSLTYLGHSYLPPPLLSLLTTALTTPSSSSPPSLPDFAPLTAHLATLAKLRAEALALRSISDNISRKRGYVEDDEKAAEREEKKRKKEEEDKRKKGESRAAKQLKKVDVSGMKKLSSFFTKKA
ncbi:hypothetical protein N0V90_001029 [Kalmusia sp. IMI 367209]|nr:hypothetical protein N0V90_001029 [Kalmusia sp. IMI 367209]